LLAAASAADSSNAPNNLTAFSRSKTSLKTSGNWLTTD